VGPRDTNTDDALGAETFAVGTIEATFPLGLPNDLPIKGRVFTDFGTAFDTPGIAGATIGDSKALRASVGVGFSWTSPIGPLALDFGFPVVKEKFDEKEILYFSVGTKF
jgi:outer membrane protein insertion porin family